MICKNVSDFCQKKNLRSFRKIKIDFVTTAKLNASSANDFVKLKPFEQLSPDCQISPKDLSNFCANDITPQACIKDFLKFELNF